MRGRGLKKLFFFFFLWAPCALLASSQLTVNNSAITFMAGKSTIRGTARGPATVVSNITLVQSSCAASISVGTFALTFNSSVTATNWIFGTYANPGDGFNVSTDSVHNTYTDASAGGVGNGSARAVVYFATATSGGLIKVTVTSAAGSNINGCIEEVSGATKYDVQKTASVTGTNPTSGNYTTTGADICVAIMSHSSAGTTLTPGAGQTQIGEDENNSTHQTYNAEYFNPTAGTNASTWTSSSVAYVIDVVCAK